MSDMTPEEIAEANGPPEYLEFLKRWPTASAATARNMQIAWKAAIASTKTPEEVSPLAYRVHLTYFKGTGKFYSDDVYDTEEVGLQEIWDEVLKMKTEGTLPGLAPNCREFIIIISVPGHPHDHPKMII